MGEKSRVHWQLIPMIVLLLVLIGWLILELGGILTLDDVVTRLNEIERITAAATIVGLLVVDIVIPIPSTLVMPMAGNIFGVFWGTVLAVIGSMGASLAGYVIGKKGGRPLAQRFITSEELDKMERWMYIHGKWPVVIAKAVPMMAETVSVSAGIAKMPFIPFAFYTFVGTVITCFLYVIAGEKASSVEEIFMIAVFGFIVALVVAAYIRRQTEVPRELREE